MVLSASEYPSINDLIIFEDFMKHFTISLILLTALFAFTQQAPLYGQKKAETKLYKSVVAKGDTLSYNKFLAKYPKSVYANEIRQLKEELIRSYNTSSLSIPEAEEIVKSTLSELAQGKYGENFILLPGKKDNVDHIVVIKAPVAPSANFEIIKIEKDNSTGNWNSVITKSEAPYNFQGHQLSKFSFLGTGNLFSGADAKEVVLKGEKFMLFNYINFTDGVDERTGWEKNECDVISNLVSMNDCAIFNAVFAGERDGDAVLGKCHEESQGGMMGIPQINYLVAYFKTLPELKPMEKEYELTKEAIKWWYEHNPAGSSKLDFGVLDENHPIIKAFKATKTKEVSENNSADFFNIMGTTVLCVYNKNNSQYLLVWCEPQPKNTNTQKTLNTIYFEKNNTLVLYYYHGKRAIKERISLATRQKK